MKALLAQVRTELTLTARNGEQLLVSLFIPLGVLIFLSKVNVIDLGRDDRVAVVAPAVLALAVMSTAMVSLGIGTGFERHYGVLKRLGATPLGRPRWIAAKFLAVLAIECLQWIVLVGAALALGWSPSGGWALAVAAAMVGTAAFGGLGLSLAGSLPALVNLALCNGLYVVLVMTGDIVFRAGSLPGPIETIARLLPAAPLVDVISAALDTGHTVHAGSWPTLLVWAIVGPIVAATSFRWE